MGGGERERERGREREREREGERERERERERDGTLKVRRSVPHTCGVNSTEAGLSDL